MTLPANIAEQPLTIGQRALWSVYAQHPGCGAYNITYAWEVFNANIPALKKAIISTSNRIPIFNSRFLENNGNIYLSLGHPCLASISTTTLRDTDDITRVLEMEKYYPFNLHDEPPARWKHYAWRNRNFIFFQIQHTAGDVWSVMLAINKIKNAYSDILQGAHTTWEPTETSIFDFIKFQENFLKSDEGLSSAKFWREKLPNELPTLQLPTDSPRPPVATFNASLVSLELGNSTLQAIQHLSNMFNCSAFAVHYSIFALLIARYSKQNEIIIGTPTAGRSEQFRDLFGYYVNTIINNFIFSDQPLEEYLRSETAKIAETLIHRNFPFALVAQDLKYERDASRTPIYQVQFVYENANRFENRDTPMVTLNHAGQETWNLAPMEWQRLQLKLTIDQFDLTFKIIKAHDRFTCQVEYNSDIFTKATAERILKNYIVLLSTCTNELDLPLSKLTMIGPDEMKLLLVSWNQTEKDYHLNGKNLLNLFEDRVKKSPASLALKFGDMELSYGELDTLSTKLGAIVAEHGAGPNSLVGICMERSIEMVLAIYGILKAGAAYTPIDPDLPAERIHFLIDDTLSPIVLTHPYLMDSLNSNTTLFPLTVQALQEKPSLPRYARPAIHPLDMAYMIYTSGSTGKPKGVINNHIAICNRLIWMQDAYALNPTDRVLQKTPFNFDVSVWEFFWPLQVGATLVIASPGLHKDPHALMKLISQEEITTLHFVPSMLSAFLDQASDEHIHTIKRVFCSGEALPLSTQNRFFAKYPHTELHNLYGPTEAAVDVTFWPCAHDKTYVPIGRPIANIRIFVLDRHLNPAPIGVAGELHIAGIGLARGYHRRPGLTSEKFIADPYAEQPGSRMYKSGDSVRYLLDGNLEYLGRLDFQVKIRGLRIELGEISAAIDKHPSIKESLVVVQEYHQRKRLVAYLVPLDPAAFFLGAVHRHLKEQLPEYMIPASFVTLSAFPTTSNGKVDRKALPLPEFTAHEQEPKKPTNEMETLLEKVWCQVLNLHNVGVNQNFFEMGGDSILVFKVIGILMKHGIALTPSQILLHQTIENLAQFAMSLPAVALRQKTIVGPVPLTPIQHWFFDRIPDPTKHWNMSAAFRLGSFVEPDRLERALNALIDHHDALRSRFFRTSSVWSQEVVENTSKLVLTVTDKQNQELALQSLHQGISIENGRVLLALLVRDEPPLLILVAHHLVMDGVSWRVLQEDLEALLVDISQEKLCLPPKTSSFQEWSTALHAYAHSEKLKAEVAYWRTLIEKPVTPWPEAVSPYGTVSTEQVIRKTWTKAQTHRLLREAPRRLQAHINDLLLSALTYALQRWLGDFRVLVDLEGHGREDISDQLSLARTVGWFTSIYPIAIEASGAFQIHECLIRLAEERARRPQNGIGYGILAWISSELPRNYGAHILFNYLGQIDQEASELLCWSPEPTGPNRDASHPRSHAFEIISQIQDDQYCLSWYFSEETHSVHQVTVLVDNFFNALEMQLDALEQNPERTTLSTFFTSPEQETLCLFGQNLSTRLSQTLPLTASQEGILISARLHPNDGTYIVQTCWELDGLLDLPNLQLAWDRTVQQYAALRTSFHHDLLDRPIQIVHDSAAFRINYCDWSDTHILVEEEYEILCHEDRTRPFNLTEPPLMRLTVVTISAEKHRLVWTNHHLILDGWSWPIVLRSAFSAYRNPHLLMTEEYAFSTYLHWLNTLPRDFGKDFWRRQLKGLEAPTELRFPTPVSSSQKDPQDRRQVILGPSLADDLKTLAKRHHVTLNSVFQTAWAILLSHYSGESDILFGVTVSGRPSELEHVDEMVGMFINTLPFRLQLQRNIGFDTLLQTAQQRMFEIRQYESCTLTDIQSWCEMSLAKPLFDTLFVFENYPQDATFGLAGSDLKISLRAVHERTNFPMVLAVFPGPEVIELALASEPSRFPIGTATRVISHLVTLLESVISKPLGSIDQLEYLTQAERRILLLGLNDAPGQPCPDFPDLVERLPDNDDPFLLFAGKSEKSLTLRAFKREVRQLANALMAHGAGPEVAIAFCMTRGLEMVVTMAAILKAGAFYIPIDPNFPKDRIDYMLTDANAALIVTDNPSAFASVDVVCLDYSQAMAQEPSLFHPPKPDPNNLSYMIYTSGSTGRPKGVQLTRGSFYNLLLSIQAEPGMCADDTLLAVSTVSFDIAGVECLLPLYVGAKMVMTDAASAMSGQALAHLIQRYDITVMQATPVSWRLLIESGWEGKPGFKVYCGGEPMAVDLAEGLRARASFVWNMYGPTETTIYSTIEHVDRKFKTIAIGRPIRNTTTYVVGPHFNLLPEGIPGELLIGGKGLARGYWQRPTLTATQFVPNPFACPGEEGDRLYRTGDLARIQANGTIECLGRVDHQVKLRGFRIELGEIEAVLNSHPMIVKAVAAIKEINPGDPRLVGYLVLDSGVSFDDRQLTEDLAHDLPHYMIPTAFVALESFPLTPNRKIDRRALPLPESKPSAELKAPASETEAILLTFWQEVLGHKDIGTDQDFFRLGGHSLLITRLQNRIRNHFAIDLDLSQFFSKKTIEQMAELISALRQSQVDEHNDDFEYGEI